MLSKKLKSQKGLTLIELMVVLAIIGLIGAVVVVNVMGNLKEARIETTKQNMRVLETALQNYNRKMGSYPSSDQGLEALVSKPSSGKVPENYPSEGFLEKGKVPTDAWGEAFIYNSPAQGHPYEIISLGADKTEGGEGENADIKNWDL